MQDAAPRPDPLGEVRRDLAVVLALLEATRVQGMGRKRGNRFAHAVAEDDFAELDRLARLPDGRRQYSELLFSGELVEACEQAAAKRARAAAG